jgi:K+-transporting ATPase ATPase C chain
MKNFLTEIRIAVIATLIFAVITCGIYPLAVWAFGQVLFHSQANGSLITNSQGTVIGSKLLGQEFTEAQYFHGRPSDAGTGYDATASSGSNLGPTSQKLADEITQNIADYRAENNLSDTTPVPADAVTASASGLDPEISVQNAEIQLARVAKARAISTTEVQALITKNTESRTLGILGESGVNVLTLNIALDNLYPVQ